MCPGLPPTCDQSVVWPLKMASICLRLRLGTALPLLTTIAMPSSAKTCSQAGEVMSPRAVSIACSAGLILREDMPMSHSAFARESNAVPEPRPQPGPTPRRSCRRRRPGSNTRPGPCPGTRVILDQPSSGRKPSSKEAISFEPMVFEPWISSATLTGGGGRWPQVSASPWAWTTA